MAAAALAVSAGAPDEDLATAEQLATTAAGYLGQIDHVAVATRVAARLHTEYPEVVADLGLPDELLARVVALSSILTVTTMVGDVLEAAELAAAFALDPASTLDPMSDGPTASDDG